MKICYIVAFTWGINRGINMTSFFRQILFQFFPKCTHTMKHSRLVFLILRKPQASNNGNGMVTLKCNWNHGCLIILGTDIFGRTLAMYYVSMLNNIFEVKAWVPVLRGILNHICLYFNSICMETTQISMRKPFLKMEKEVKKQIFEKLGRRNGCVDFINFRHDNLHQSRTYWHELGMHNR